MDKETQKLQEFISELPSSPKEGTLVNIDETLQTLGDAAYHVPTTEDSKWSWGRKHMIDGLMGMPDAQRLKVLQETPEYQKLLKEFKDKDDELKRWYKYNIKTIKKEN